MDSITGSQLFVGCWWCRDGMALHIHEVEPVDGKTSDYGFVQQLRTFPVLIPKRTPTTGDIGISNILIAIPYQYCKEYWQY